MNTKQQRAHIDAIKEAIVMSIPADTEKSYVAWALAELTREFPLERRDMVYINAHKEQENE